MLRLSRSTALRGTLIVFSLCQFHLRMHGAKIVFTKLNDVTDKNCPDEFTLMTSTDIYQNVQCASLCLKYSRCQGVAVNEKSGWCQIRARSTRLSNSCSAEMDTLHYGKLQAGCPSGYSWHDGARMCFKVSTSCGSWHSNREQCQLEGTDLLVLSNPDFWTFFQGFIQNSFQFQCEDGVWLGAWDVPTEGEWVWLDGAPVAGGWGSGNPGGGTVENCMVLSYIGEAHDYPCDSQESHLACGIAM